MNIKFLMPSNKTIILLMALASLGSEPISAAAQSFDGCAGSYEGMQVCVDTGIGPNLIVEAEILPDGRGCITRFGSGSFRILDSGVVEPIAHEDGVSTLPILGCQATGFLVSGTFDFDTCTLHLTEEELPNNLCSRSYVLTPVGGVPGPPPEEEEDECTENTFFWDGAGGGIFSDDSKWLDGEAPTVNSSTTFEGRLVDDGTVTLNRDTTLDSILVADDSIVLDLNLFSLDLEGETGCFTAMEIGDANDSSLRIVGISNVTSKSLRVGVKSGQSGELEIHNSSLVDIPVGECVIGSEGSGSVDASDGGDLHCQRLVVGEKSGSQGMVNVSGDTSTLVLENLSIGKEVGSSGSITLDDAGKVEFGSAEIADAGTATLVMSNGSVATHTDPSKTNSAVKLALAPGSDGIVIVEGQDTRLTTGQFEIGVDGTGDLFIQDQAFVSSTVALVGALSQGVGQVAVTDGGTWEVERAIFVGTLGDGTVGAAPGSKIITPRFVLGPKGRLEVLDVDIRGPSGIGAKTAPFRNRVIVGTRPGLTTESLVLENGAELVTESVTLGPGGQLAGDGTLDFDLRNPGDLSPGLDECTAGKFVINGDYIQEETGQLHIKLGGRVQGTSHDLLAVNGKTTLSGTLKISAVENFRPQSGDVFEIVIAESIAGKFATIDGSGEYEIEYGRERVRLKVLSSPSEVAETCSITGNDNESNTTLDEESQENAGFCGIGVLTIMPLAMCCLLLFHRFDSGKIRRR